MHSNSIVSDQVDDLKSSGTYKKNYMQKLNSIGSISAVNNPLEVPEIKKKTSAPVDIIEENAAGAQEEQEFLEDVSLVKGETSNDAIRTITK